jgi:hypothetical protein
LKKFETKKLFYGTFPYKLVWTSPVAVEFRGGNLAKISSLIDNLQLQKRTTGQIHYNRFLLGSVISYDHLKEIQALYTALTYNADYKLRVEINDVCIFSHESEWLRTLADNLESVTQWWEPAGNNLQPNTILMKNMHDWQYKITLNNHVPDTFAPWVENNLEKIRIGNKLLANIREGDTYLNGYHFYVKNDRYLSLVRLVLGKSLRRIDKVISES